MEREAQRPSVLDARECANQAREGLNQRDRIDLQVLRALRHIIRAVDIHSRRLSSRHKITGPQLICLLAIEEMEPATASTVARHVHLSASTVVGIVDRLEARGLVSRLRDTTDRRLVHLTLTGAGVDLLREAPPPLQDRLAVGLNALDGAEQATIATALERLVQLMEAEEVEAAHPGDEPDGDKHRRTAACGPATDDEGDASE